MDSSRLLIDMGTLLARLRDIRQVLRKEACEALLKARCALLEEHPGVPKLLEGITRERPDLYEFALCSAALTLPLSQALALPQESGDMLFLAALLQDCGLLAQPGDQADAKRPLAYEEHPHLGQELVKAHCTAPGELAALIANQHERHDGTGYPAGKLEPELSAADLALSTIGELVRIRLSEDPGQNRTLTDCVPILRFNQGPHFTRPCRELFAILSRAAIAPGAPWDEAEAATHIEALIDDIALVQRWLQQLPLLSRALGGLPMTRNVARCRLFAQELQYAASSAGIADDGLVRWARHVSENGLTDFFNELREVADLHEEFFHRLNWIPEFLDSVVMEGTNLPRALQALRENMATLGDHRAKRRGEDGLIMMDI